MDKLITTNNGGMPFDLDDLRWIETSLFDTLKSIGDMINHSGLTIFKVTGANTTDVGSVINVSAGIVFANGEFYKVAAHSLTKLVVSGSYYWKEVITYDPTGTETFENSSSIETYQIRKMELTHTVADGAMSGNSVAGLHLESMSDLWVKKSVFDTLNNQVNAYNGIEPNLIRSAHVRQVMNIGASYGSFTDLTSTYSARGGDSNLYASGNSLGIKMKKLRLYKIEINCPSYTSDVIRIKNFPLSHKMYSGHVSRSASGNVDIDPSQTRMILCSNESNADVTLTFAVKFDGVMIINVMDMGDAVQY